MHLIRGLTFVFATLTSHFLFPTLSQEPIYVGADEPRTDPQVYGQGVRETPWLAPAEEQAGFHLPPGFRIDLFACEPQLAKPLNMAWDARGRLWVTSSREYPYPAAEKSQPRDTLQILEDTDGDGRADKSTTFADGLNIPMGVLPVREGAICFSIPNLWLLRDVDGDDRADERTKILGPFDTSRDTHGMVNSLTRGDDGWIYACHGFNNQSDITAADGSRVRLHSGNTFRFREDGSRVELVTQGQVNPFGMTRDQWGHWYSADCHSKPLTALLPGGCYPSFGRPHDGLGFAPAMMDHLHGSTAICGLQYYDAAHFPPAYRQRFFSGNVMTSRINCNALQWQGATAIAEELPDFLTSDDPWFRPVDIQLGADGALYVADFYNKIIGHYEVPLDHPGRDRDSGRIWKISYTGEPSEHRSDRSSTQGKPRPGLKIDPSHLLQELAATNSTRRRLATDLAVSDDLFTSDMVAAILHNEQQPETLRQSCLEVLFRRNCFEATHARPLAAEAHQSHLLVQQISLACELPATQRIAFAAQIRDSLPYALPQATRAACRLLGQAGEVANVTALIDAATQAADPAVAHTARIALKQILSQASQLSAAMLQVSGTDREQVLMEILPAVDTQLSAVFLLDYIAAHADASSPLVEAALHLATKHASEPLLTKLLEVIQKTHVGNWIAQAQRLEQICDAYLSNHAELPAVLKNAGAELQRQWLASELERQLSSGSSLDWSDAQGTQWALEERATAEGATVRLLSSFPRGERYTGKLTSETFACPTELRFLLAGHNGFPAQPDARRNKVELQLVSTGETLQTAFPPRSDVATMVEWQLMRFADQPVQLIITDADAGKAYAWLACGQFSLAALNANLEQNGFATFLSLIRRGHAPLEQQSVERLQLSARQRARLVAAALQGSGSMAASHLAQWALQLGRPELAGGPLMAANGTNELFPVAKQLAATATSSQQPAFASTLLRTAEGCRLLQQLLGDGSLALHSLQNAEPLWPAALDLPTREFLQTKIELAAAQAPPVHLTAQRIAAMDWSIGNRDLGRQLYQQHCAACHQLRGQGAIVGPQLDGAVVRGVERLSEDILEPNLNVDAAFRVSVILLDDDSVLQGLLREESGGVIAITGQDGRSQQVPAARIQQRRDSHQSLMPANFGELLSDQQFASLMAFLKHGEP